MAAAQIETEDMACCPVCLEQFNTPRQLPCAHSFCEKCLQSHITTESTKHTKLIDIKCPVCRISASPSIKDRPTSEWASLFPINTVLQSILPAKSKVDRLCDACNTEGTAAVAEGFCVVCNEAMCGDCLKAHRKLKLLKDHAIISMEELVSNPENVLKLAEGFTCSEHHGEDIKYYCKNHNVPCCASCFFLVHKICSKVIDLKEEISALLCDSKTDEIIADMKEIEIHLKKFMEINDSTVNTLEPQVNTITDQIREIRKKISSVLDELEKQIMTEGNRIYKEVVIRKQEENYQCLSLIHAVRNSRYLFESVHKYGSNLQRFLMAEKMKSQLYSYCTLVGEKYEKTEAVTFDVQFAHPIESILSLSLSELGKVVTTINSNTLPLTCSHRPSKDCQVEMVEAIDLKVSTVKTPSYCGVTFLPGDRLMLADHNSSQCILLSSSYQFITSHTLTGQPMNICVLGDEEVAVSLTMQNQIQILSVVGDIISPVRMIKTKYNPGGITAAGNGDMIVTSSNSDSRSHWSLINAKGDVKCTHQYDYKHGKYNYIAVNNTKTRVYVTLHDVHSLLCFNINGRKQFTYSPDNLRGPRGVAVDRYDNIYVLGTASDNIHQLSSDGSILQVMTSRVPKSPRSICIHQSKDMLIITNDSDMTKLHIYQLK